MIRAAKWLIQDVVIIGAKIASRLAHVIAGIVAVAVVVSAIVVSFVIATSPIVGVGVPTI